MQAGDTQATDGQEIRYYASYYISRQHGEIIFSRMQVESIDQLIECEPVLVLDLGTAPEAAGSALKAILAESNPKQAENNPWLEHRLLDIVQARIFYTPEDYPKNDLLNPEKQAQAGSAYINRPAYQASKAETIDDFGKYYLHFRIEATDGMIFINTVFNEWDPVRLSKQVPLHTSDEALGAVLLEFSKACR